MQEDFLHYVWKYQKFNDLDLRSTSGESITVVNVGQHNNDSGPDFFNAQITIDNQLWAGNVEVHINSSDWYVHSHEQDPSYDNVILHVVWDHDSDIFRKDNSVIPTLVINPYVDNGILLKYTELMSKKDQFINCEKDFHTVDEFILTHWIERVYIERLEAKSRIIDELLRRSNNDWEAVLFKMLAKYFGLKVNSDSFFNMAQSFDFSIVRKLKNDPIKLEALFFGQLQMFQDHVEEEYQTNLKKEYDFLQKKFNIDGKHVIPVKYFRLRPPNFPTIRLSQLASLYTQNSNLFSQIQNLDNREKIYNLFNVSTSAFWQTHYTFAKSSKFSSKNLTKSFIDLLIINVIIPLRFCHSKSVGNSNSEVLITLSEQLVSEKNSIVSGFRKLRDLSNTALVSQGLIQLKKEYCDKNMCLHCEIGNKLLNK